MRSAARGRLIVCDPNGSALLDTQPHSDPTIVIDHERMILDASVFATELAANPRRLPLAPILKKRDANRPASLNQAAIYAQRVAMHKVTGLRKLRRHSDDSNTVANTQITPYYYRA